MNGVGVGAMGVAVLVVSVESDATLDLVVLVATTWE